MWLSVHSEKGRTPRGDVSADKAPKKCSRCVSIDGSHRDVGAICDVLLLLLLVVVLCCFVGVMWDVGEYHYQN